MNVIVIGWTNLQNSNAEVAGLMGEVPEFNDYTDSAILGNI